VRPTHRSAKPKPNAMRRIYGIGNLGNVGEGCYVVRKVLYIGPGHTEMDTKKNRELGAQLNEEQARRKEEASVGCIQTRGGGPTEGGRGNSQGR
jgi:hypothetical protein